MTRIVVDAGGAGPNLSCPVRIVKLNVARCLLLLHDALLKTQSHVLAAERRCSLCLTLLAIQMQRSSLCQREVSLNQMFLSWQPKL